MHTNEAFIISIFHNAKSKPTMYSSQNHCVRRVKKSANPSVWLCEFVSDCVFGSALIPSRFTLHTEWKDCAELRLFSECICLYVPKAWFLVFIPPVFIVKTISLYDKSMIGQQFWISRKVWIFRFLILCSTVNTLQYSLQMLLWLASWRQGVRIWVYCIFQIGKNICLH